eukprot:scpid15675/ scgid1114/ 
MTDQAGSIIGRQRTIVSSAAWSEGLARRAHAVYVVLTPEEIHAIAGPSSGYVQGCRARYGPVWQHVHSCELFCSATTVAKPILKLGKPHSQSGETHQSPCGETRFSAKQSVPRECHSGAELTSVLCTKALHYTRIKIILFLISEDMNPAEQCHVLLIPRVVSSPELLPCCRVCNNVWVVIPVCCLIPCSLRPLVTLPIRSLKIGKDTRAISRLRVVSFERLEYVLFQQAHHHHAANRLCVSCS